MEPTPAKKDGQSLAIGENHDGGHGYSVEIQQNSTFPTQTHAHEHQQTHTVLHNRSNEHEQAPNHHIACNHGGAVVETDEDTKFTHE